MCLRKACCQELVALTSVLSCILLLQGCGNTPAPAPAPAPSPSPSPLPPPSPSPSPAPSLDNWQLKAESAAVALQSRWFDASRQSWLVTYWWQGGHILDAILRMLMNSKNQTIVDKFSPTIFSVLSAHNFTRLILDGEACCPLVDTNEVNLGTDDIAWWLIALIQAYEWKGDAVWLDTARDVFDYVYKVGWNTTICGPSFWWNSMKYYKNAIVNSLYILVAARLHRHIQGDTYYLSFAKQLWHWFEHSGLINSANLVNDGLDSSSCKNNLGETWTYNQGVLIGALTELFQSTANKTLLTQAWKIAEAVMRKKVTRTSCGNVLEESDVSSPDQPMYKGICMEYLARLAEVSHSASLNISSIVDFIRCNALSLTTNDTDGTYYGALFQGPFDRPGPARQTSALDALNAAALMEATQSTLIA